MRKKLGISIDGVLRDTYEQFDKIYRKRFIKNDSIVEMDNNFQYVPSEEPGEDELDKLIKKSAEKITLPVNSYDLQNHYHFEDKQAFDKFNEENAFELLGLPSSYPRVMDYVNRMQAFGEANNLFDVVILSKEKDKAITSSLHFLSKSGCKVRNYKFVDEHVDKWNHCDVLIDDCPISFENKPDGKVSIKIEKEYNSYSEADYNFKSVIEVYDLDFMIKLFAPHLLIDRTEKKEI